MGRRSRASRQLALLVVLGAAGWLGATNGRAQSTQEILPPVGAEIVQVDAVVTGKQGLHYLVYVYRSDAASAEPVEVTLQAHLWSGGKLQGVGPTHNVKLAGPGPSSPRQAKRISLESLPPGAYELRILVKSKEPADTAERRVSFTLE